jgi:hypothetical protein
MSFVLVLGVVLTSPAKAADPNLVGWWTFDDGSGDTASDSSGLDHHGTMISADWVPGIIGGALDFKGSGHVSVPPESWSSIEKQVTVAFWAYGHPAAQPQANFIFGAFQDPGVNGSRVASSHCPWSNGQVYFDTGGTVSNGYDRINQAATADQYEGQWRHWAFTKNADTGEQNIYYQGSLWHSGTGMTSIMTGVTAFTIGCKPSLENYYAGMMDEFRLYDRALTEAEIQRLATLATAHDPFPADGAIYEDTWVSLQWSAGGHAVSHDVYMGESFADVDAGTGDAFRGNQDTEMFIVGFFGFPYPDGLVPGTTYYWRIDEVNDLHPDSPWRGDVWSFTVPPRIAYDPDPPDDARHVLLDATLSWTAGFGAKLHYVYFGDNFDDVNNAVGGQLLTDTTYTPSTLESEKTYYWRVDESDGATTFEGDVWSFTTIPAIPISDPNFIAWWKLDEGSGNTALDWSGHGNHAAIGGTSDFVSGYDGDALDFDGSSDYIDVDGQIASGTFTLTMWIRPRDIPYSSGYYAVLHDDAWNAGSVHVHLRNTSSLINADINSGPGVESTTVLQEDEWYNCALTVTDVGGNASQLYINGILENSGSGGDGTPYLGPMNIGAWENGTSRHYHGLMDDIRVYDKVLTLDEIEQAMRGDVTRAWNPSPANGSTSDVERATPLTWSPGEKASGHDVYFGTDNNAVTNADASDTTGVYRGQQVATSYTPPEGVEWAGGPYYWRIDEINTDGTITRGSIWSFTVADYVLIDDFESYNDVPAEEPGSNLVYRTWIDGYDNPATNGSTMGYPTGASMETDIVHGGRQSVPLLYSNIAVSISEVTRTFAVPQNWTNHGLTTLSLWFHGAVTNMGGQLYVKVNGVEAPYDGDAANLMRPMWQVWNIDLTSLSANLQSVTNLLIGIRGPGTTGTLILDDIRLYQSAPEPAEEIWLEAESAASVTPPMKVYNDPSASAGRYIGTDDGIGDENDNPPADGIATYSFAVDGGVYKIVFRAKPDLGNSFWIRIPGATDYDPGTHGSGWIRFNDIEAGAEWHWDDVHSSDHSDAVVKITLPAGQHTLEVARREDGALLDAILITDNVE